MTWCRKVDAQLLRVNAWINRAALCPIDLSLRIGGVAFKADNREDAIKRYEALVNLLLPTSRRWQSVHFAWQVQFVTESVLKLFEEPQFPLLRKASFFISAEKNGSATQHARACRLSRSPLFATPSLRDVTLTGYWENIAAAKASTSSLLYKSITHLSLDADSLDSDLPFDCSQALDVLKSLPNLISAKFSLHDSCPPLRPLSPPVHCPHLTSMTLESKPVSKGFGPSIYLPVLESLHFGYAPFHQAENPDLNGHEELLLQQGSRLKELTLYHEKITRGSLPRCLATLSNLTNLKLCSMPIRSLSDDEPDRFLLAQLSVRGVLPRLEELELRHMSNTGDGLLENAVVTFLAQRAQSTAEGAGERCGGDIERIHAHS
jgi:hypothetical protein